MCSRAQLTVTCDLYQTQRSHDLISVHKQSDSNIKDKNCTKFQLQNFPKSNYDLSLGSLSCLQIYGGPESSTRRSFAQQKQAKTSSFRNRACFQGTQKSDAPGWETLLTSNALNKVLNIKSVSVSPLLCPLETLVFSCCVCGLSSLGHRRSVES